MSKTKHMQARMSQRAIREELLDLVRRFGVILPNGKQILTRKGLQSLQVVLRDLLCQSERALQKGGLAIVEDDGVQITTYGFGRKSR